MSRLRFCLNNFYACFEICFTWIERSNGKLNNSQTNAMFFFFPSSLRPKKKVINSEKANIIKGQGEEEGEAGERIERRGYRCIIIQSGARVALSTYALLRIVFLMVQWYALGLISFDGSTRHVLLSNLLFEYISTYPHQFKQ